jgi:hypothetical protein
MIKDNKDLFGSLDDPLWAFPPAAPWVAFMQENWLDLFSDRVACQTYQPVYGMDLGSLRATERSPDSERRKGPVPRALPSSGDPP